MEKNISIFVVMHKVIEKKPMKGFKSLLVGAKNYKDDVPLNIEKDDSIKDNISEKNSNHCELTGLYWMWKNNKIDDEEIIGLCHYRRYFLKNILSVNKQNYLNYDNIERLMSHYDIILPKRRASKEKIMDGFTNAPRKEDMDKTREIIKNMYPEYVDSFDSFLNQNESYLYNMFIAKKSIMNEYFKWLFDILFELEKQVDISNYSEYEARIYGFIAERLLNVWVLKNKDRLKVKEKYVYNETDTYLSFLKHEIASIYRRMRYGR